jgi:hypothetical protein
MRLELGVSPVLSGPPAAKTKFYRGRFVGDLKIVKFTIDQQLLAARNFTEGSINSSSSNATYLYTHHVPISQA